MQTVFFFPDAADSLGKVFLLIVRIGTSLLRAGLIWMRRCSSLAALRDSAGRLSRHMETDSCALGGRLAHAYPEP